MYINYITREVTRVVKEEVVEGFCLNINVPVQIVREIVERHFNQSGNYGLAGFNKINAIKEVRSLTHSIRTTGYGMGTSYNETTVASVGLREAKEMVEAVHLEGTEAGKYRVSRPYEAPEEEPDDTLPF